MSTVIYSYHGRTVTKEELDHLVPPKANWLDAPPMASNTYSEHDPLVSEGCGVMKAQVGEARELIKKHGIQGAQVLNSGQIRFTSRNARKEFLKMRGLVDNDGGYSDG
jgi:hypothetical protein